MIEQKRYSLMPVDPEKQEFYQWGIETNEKQFLMRDQFGNRYGVLRLNPLRLVFLYIFIAGFIAGAMIL